MSENEILSNRIDAINKLHAYLNETVPQIKSIFLKYVGKKVVNKTTGGFVEALKKEVEQFTKYDEQIRKHFRVSSHSIYFCVDICYRTGEFSNAYFKRDFFIAECERVNNTLTFVSGEKCALKTNFDLSTVLEKQAEVKKIRDEMGEKLRLIEKEIYPVIK